MLNSQVDRLREIAESIDWEMPEVAMLMCEAADTIISLRDRLQDAELGSDASAVRLAERLRSIANEMRNVGASSMTTHELLACYASDVNKVADLLTFASTLGNGTCEQVLSDCDDGLMPPFTVHCSACGAEWGFTPKYCHNCGAKVVRVCDERKTVG